MDNREYCLRDDSPEFVLYRYVRRIFWSHVVDGREYGEKGKAYFRRFLPEHTESEKRFCRWVKCIHPRDMWERDSICISDGKRESFFSSILPLVIFNGYLCGYLHRCVGTLRYVLLIRKHTTDRIRFHIIRCKNNILYLFLYVLLDSISDNNRIMLRHYPRKSKIILEAIVNS